MCIYNKMQSTRITLQTTGEQDRYLTDNPIHTHFKTNYRQHTEFGSDWIVVGNDNKNISSIAANSSFYFRIEKDGDLINNLFLRLKLEKDNNWKSSQLGLYETALKIIDRVEFLNNDQVISSMSSDYMFSYFELHYSKAEKKALFDMISYDKSSVGESSNYVTLYLPLPLWFHKNPGNAFPLWALNNPNVGINIKTGDYGNLNIVENIELLVDFGFLDNKEKEQFTNKPLEYLIEVPEKLDNITLSGLAETKKLNLIKTHFVRYLLWNIQEDGKFNYLDDVENANISFNGNPLISNAPGSFYNRVMRYMNFESNGTLHSTNGDFNKNTYSNIYTYSFCLNPTSQKLSGYLTTEKFNNVEIEINTKSSGNSRILNVYLVKHNIMRVSNGVLNLLYN